MGHAEWWGGAMLLSEGVGQAVVTVETLLVQGERWAAVAQANIAVW
jgi:hypothetical protein